MKLLSYVTLKKGKVLKIAIQEEKSLKDAMKRNATYHKRRPKML